ncbi:GTPase domain-containing protein [Stenotrophomonas sp.]|uniref:GTPase domain-containing protein n=1 Tax=Stenotrophomonas sp. TaxID=69392 RepID=UPI0028AD7D3D|nr:GTPase domain-containing protein [Stenotrophomonas sp.]
MILAAAAGVAASAIAYFKRDEIAAAWDSLVISLKGKRVAVLGERNVGKTVLLKFLANGDIPEEYMQTLLVERIEGRRFSIGDLKLDLKGTRDVPGGRDAIEDWKALHDESDIVLYLVNAQQIDDQRIMRDLGKLDGWSATRKSRPRLVVLVTHMDLNSEYVRTPGSGLGTFRDQFVQRHLDSGLSRLQIRPPVLLGSLVDKDQAAKLVADVIRTVTV